MINAFILWTLGYKMRTQLQMLQRGFSLTWIGSRVSLIGPTHSSVAETCRQNTATWPTAANWAQHTHGENKAANTSYHFTIDVQKHAGTSVHDLSVPTSVNLLSYLLVPVLSVHNCGTNKHPYIQLLYFTCCGCLSYSWTFTCCINC